MAHGPSRPLMRQLMATLPIAPSPYGRFRQLNAGRQHRMTKQGDGEDDEDEGAYPTSYAGSSDAVTVQRLCLCRMIASFVGAGSVSSWTDGMKWSYDRVGTASRAAIGVNAMQRFHHPADVTAGEAA